MAHVLESAGLPPLLETMMRPWVSAVETATLGMREVVSSAASSAASNLKRRVVVVPALDIAIAEAVVASVAFAQALDQRGADTTRPRAVALAALMVVIEKLQRAAPSDDTRAIGLGW